MRCIIGHNFVLLGYSSPFMTARLRLVRPQKGTNVTLKFSLNSLMKLNIEVTESVEEFVYKFVPRKRCHKDCPLTTYSFSGRLQSLHTRQPSVRDDRGRIRRQASPQDLQHEPGGRCRLPVPSGPRRWAPSHSRHGQARRFA